MCYTWNNETLGLPAFCTILAPCTESPFQKPFTVPQTELVMSYEIVAVWIDGLRCDGPALDPGSAQSQKVIPWRLFSLIACTILHPKIDSGEKTYQVKVGR